VQLHRQKLIALRGSVAGDDNQPAVINAAATDGLVATAVPVMLQQQPSQELQEQLEQQQEQVEQLEQLEQQPQPVGDVSTAGSLHDSAAVLAAELESLEQELDVADILLCRSLAEVAVDRRNAAASGESDKKEGLGLESRI
jgi:hypothetical protein